MYIPLSFMGGTAATASCNCTNYVFQTLVTTGSTITYKPCNAEALVVENFAANTNNSLCVGDRVFTYTNSLNSLTSDTPCLQADCVSCDCYEFFYQTSVDPVDHYISYIPCNATSASTQIIGPFAPLTTGSVICSFPWMAKSISGSLDQQLNGPSGFVKLVNSGSCQPIPSGSIQVGDLRGGGVVLYVSGSYPNQKGLIAATASVATSSANFNRWGYYGTVTGINNQAYGAGASNTAALRNYVPTTGSIAANAVTQSINGYNDWFIPSTGEALSSSRNNIDWPDVPFYVCRTCQPEFYELVKVPGLNSYRSVLTSTEKYDGTTAQRQQFARVVRRDSNEQDTSKNATDAFFAYRYFTSSLVP